MRVPVSVLGPCCENRHQIDILCFSTPCGQRLPHRTERMCYQICTEFQKPLRSNRMPGGVLTLSNSTNWCDTSKNKTSESGRKLSKYRSSSLTRLSRNNAAYSFWEREPEGKAGLRLYCGAAGRLAGPVVSLIRTSERAAGILGDRGFGRSGRTRGQRQRPPRR
jgi:hypothetical protein